MGNKRIKTSFRERFDNDKNMKEAMAEFARIVNMETMSTEILKVI
jgi:hypothetical protein